MPVRSPSLMIRISGDVRRSPGPRCVRAGRLRSALRLLLMAVAVGDRRQRRQAHGLGTSLLFSLMVLPFLVLERYRRCLRVHALVEPAQHWLSGS